MPSCMMCLASAMSPSPHLLCPCSLYRLLYALCIVSSSHAATVPSLLIHEGPVQMRVPWCHLPHSSVLSSWSPEHISGDCSLSSLWALGSLAQNLSHIYLQLPRLAHSRGLVSAFFWDCAQMLLVKEVCAS